MADETTIDLEKIDEASEEQLAQEIDRLKGAQPPPPKPVEIDTPKPAEVVVEPDTPPPPAAAPPPEPKPADAAPKPADSQDDIAKWKSEADRAWKRARLLEKENETLKAGQQPAAPAAEQPKQPTYTDDPAEYLKAEVEGAKGELARLRIEQAERDRLAAIKEQEAYFEREHPDYREAVKFLTEKGEEEWKLTGLATVQQNALRQVINEARAGKSEYSGYLNHIRGVMERPYIQEKAAQSGRDPEDIAIYEVAKDTYLATRQREIWDGAAADGEPVPARAYRIAEFRGYAKPAVPTQAPVHPTPDPAAAREAVLQAQRISEAANSLSEATSGEGAPERIVIKNRAQILSLPDEALDALIASGQYRNL